MLGCKEEQRLRDHNVWKQILAPSLILSVTLGEFSELLEPQFLHCKMGHLQWVNVIDPFKMGQCNGSLHCKM